MTALALPSLAAAPSHYAVNPGNALATQAALALHKAGYFDPGRLHSAGGFPGALAVVRSAFAHWLHTAQAPIECANLALSVGVGAGSAIDAYETRDEPDRKPLLEIVIRNKDGLPLGTSWVLQRRYEVIERRTPGLGPTALVALSCASIWGLALWTPWMALNAAQWAYWMGEEDETGYIEMTRGDGEDPEDLDIFTRAMFDAAIPRAISSPRELIKPRELERIARGRSDAARIARLCIEIRNAGRDERKHRGFDVFMPERISETARLHHFAVVRWSDEDPSLRIYDDWANPAYENGEALEAYGWHEVPIDADALKTWFAGMERSFHITALGQQLLALIAEEEI